LTTWPCPLNCGHHVATEGELSVTHEKQSPLKGLRVLDLTGHPPGALCAVMLADLGAEVVRIDAPAQKGRRSLIFGQVALSRGKQSLALDMRHAQANAVLRRLVATFDIVIEASRPGIMAARGFGYEDASAINRGIIWCAMTGFGQTGPSAANGGHDFSYLAHSGLLAALSIEQPFHPAISIASQAAGMAAVIGIQGALLERARSGDGAFVDISLSEAATWFLTGGINALSAAPYMIAATPDRQLYRCSDDRWLAVASQEPRTWAGLCATLGFPEFTERLHKPEHAADMSAAFQAVFLTKPAAQWADELTAAGATATIVNHAAELLDDPQVQARGSVVHVGETAVPASPIRIVSEGVPIIVTDVNEPHLVGQDTARVLSLAGYSDQEIAVLANEGVI
jgi:alpha-methylacyl-CoA racemase